MPVTYREEAFIPGRARKVGRNFASTPSQCASSEAKTGPSEAVPKAPAEAPEIAESDSSRPPKPSE